MQRLAELVHDDGPGCIRLDLFGQELALRVSPERGVLQPDVGSKLIRFNEARIDSASLSKPS
ncbi:hypothetical protein VM57_06815 [Stenotrophomonas maltophilia]|uniref:Uncharacterized protein n=1 Tax=Stenotrophomonas maltophilia TaxID=40324 RepID=A0A0F5ZNY4_STEMA|nr:hypothetical protein VM57_06815 [Stenotrophomonas maltophilia]